jgi:predicted RNase H-like nuclease
VTVVGVDACKGGWVAVALRPEARPSLHYLPTLVLLATEVPDAQIVAVDIPIGLPTAGRRQADVEVRKTLGARVNSVFHTPVRPALEAATHAEATAISVQLIGSGISAQSYALRNKILEAEAWLPSAPCPVFEVHPEVSFALLLGRPASAPKKTWAGMLERKEGLRAGGIDLDHFAGGAAAAAGVDDVLDAAVAAWTGLRLLGGTATSFPDPPELDADGRDLAIWA